MDWGYQRWSLVMVLRPLAPSCWALTLLFGSQICELNKFSLSYFDHNVSALQPANYRQKPGAKKKNLFFQLELSGILSQQLEIYPIHLWNTNILTLSEDLPDSSVGQLGGPYAGSLMCCDDDLDHHLLWECIFTAPILSWEISHHQNSTRTLSLCVLSALTFCLPLSWGRSPSWLV